jgi:hypothetical protein
VNAPLGLLIRRSQVRILPGAHRKVSGLQGSYDVQVCDKGHGQGYLLQRAVIGDVGLRSL